MTPESPTHPAKATLPPGAIQFFTWDKNIFIQYTINCMAREIELKQREVISLYSSIQYFFLFFFFLFLGLHLQHMKVPRLGVKWDL